MSQFNCCFNWWVSIAVGWDSLHVREICYEHKISQVTQRLWTITFSRPEMKMLGQAVLECFVNGIYSRIYDLDVTWHQNLIWNPISRSNSLGFFIHWQVLSNIIYPKFEMNCNVHKSHHLIHEFIGENAV